MEQKKRSPAKSPEQLDSVQQAIEEHLEYGSPATAASELADLLAPDRASVVADLDRAGKRDLLGALPASSVAEILEHLEVDDAAEVSALIDVGKIAAVLDAAPPDVAADVLRAIDWSQASKILARMPDRKAVGAVLLYEDDDAGGLMTPEVVGLPAHYSAAQALAMLREADLPRENLQQLFAVDRERVLVGRLSLSDLVFAPPGRLVRDIMTRDVISVRTGADQEECARLMARYEIRSLPVVDRQGRLEGAIAIEDLVHVAEDEATEDMFKMIGLGATDRAAGPLMNSVRSRFPWLMVNLGTAVAAGYAVSLFSTTLGKLAVLAAFLPVIAGQAGIAGTQTLTLIVRSLALGEISGADARSLLVREVLLALGHGVAIASVLGVAVWVWRQDLYLGLIVGVALLLDLIVGAAAGVLVPLGMKALRIDPATASGVVVTTFTDLVGFVVFLSLATAAIGYFRIS